MAGGEEVERALDVAQHAVDLGPAGGEPAEEEGKMGGEKAVEGEEEGGEMAREVGPGVAGGRGLGRGMWVYYNH